MKFDPQKFDINGRSLIQVAGLDGPFYVTLIAGREDLWGGCFYGDQNIQFFFFRRFVKHEDGSYDLDIFKASADRHGMLPASLNFLQAEIAKKNIEILLSTRDINFPERPADKLNPNSIPRRILFNWDMKVS